MDSAELCWSWTFPYAPDPRREEAVANQGLASFEAVPRDAETVRSMIAVRCLVLFWPVWSTGRSGSLGELGRPTRRGGKGGTGAGDGKGSVSICASGCTRETAVLAGVGSEKRFELDPRGKNECPPVRDAQIISRRLLGIGFLG